MASGIYEMLKDFIHLIYPHYCLACHSGLAKGENLVCTICIHNLPRTNFHLYPDNPMYKRIAGRLPVGHAFAFLHFHKGGKAQRLLHELKYHNHPEIGMQLGRVYGHDLLLSSLAGNFDRIVPVPLHAHRFNRRGYNQSERFAAGLAETMKLICDHRSVERVEMTETQTRKSKLKRWQNVEDVFRVVQSGSVRNQRILLVDDVITTGSTIEACGQVLLDAGASSISIAGIAYTD